MGWFGRMVGSMALLCIVGCGADVSRAGDQDGTGETGEAETTSDGESGEPACVGLEFSPVTHEAFHGDSCWAFEASSAVFTTQEEVDVHTLAYCDACVGPGPDKHVCEQAPTLSLGHAIVYVNHRAHQGEPILEILSIEDCGATLVVVARETVNCELIFSDGWDAAYVEAEAKPIELMLEPGPDQCAEPG